jgi:hypothetical protein
MGFHFYPGCKLLSFSNSPQGNDDDNDAMKSETSAANPYRKAFGDATQPKTLGDTVRQKKYTDATSKDFDNESGDEFGAQGGQGRRMGFSNGKPHTQSRQKHSSDRSDTVRRNESKQW